MLRWNRIINCKKFPFQIILNFLRKHHWTSKSEITKANQSIWVVRQQMNIVLNIFPLAGKTPFQKWPEKLRRYAPTKENQEKKEKRKKEWSQSDPSVIPEWSQSGPRVVPEWSQSGPRVTSVIRVIKVIKVIGWSGSSFASLHWSYLV